MLKIEQKSAHAIFSQDFILVNFLRLISADRWAGNVALLYFFIFVPKTFDRLTKATILKFYTIPGSDLNDSGKKTME